jgi:hypothetical protein
MKSFILAGAIAGFAAGIIFFIFGSTFIRFGLIEPPITPEIWYELYGLVFLAGISLGIVWGIIFSAIYSMLYDSIPNKGALKGLYFGILIWIIKDVAAGSYLGAIAAGTYYAVTLISIGFFMWIVYGPILGYLYKKSN